MRVRKRVERAEATPAGDLLRFQRLVDNGQDLFYRYRINPLSIEYLSTAALAITGRDAQEFYDDPELGLSIVHPDDRDLLAGAIDAAGGSDPSKLRRTMLVRWIHRDGRIVWAEHQRVPVFDQHGRWVAVEGVARDVTDRVEAKRRLADSESLLRLLAENARDMIYRLAVVPHGLQYVSPAAERLTGRTPQEFLADPEAAWSAVHPEDREKARAMRTHPEASGDPVVLRWVHPDGSIVCVEHRNSPVYDASRQLIAFEGIGRDITEPLAIQTRLRDSESQLRRLAASLNSAREAERADVARELHDELGQTLTGLKLEMTRTVRDLMRRGLEPRDDRSHAVDGRQHRGRHRDGATTCLDAASAGARPSRSRRGDRARGGGDRAAHRRQVPHRRQRRRRCADIGADDGGLPHRAGGADQRGAPRQRERGEDLDAPDDPQHVADDRRQRPRHQPEGGRRSGLDRPARDARACAVDRREAVDQRPARQGHRGGRHGSGRCGARTRIRRWCAFYWSTITPLSDTASGRFWWKGSSQCSVGEASDVASASASIRASVWDVVVLDVTLPGASGLDLLKEIRQMRPALPVLVLSMHPASQFARRVLAAGAWGYLTKDSAATELVHAIDQIRRGRLYLGSRVPDWARTPTAENRRRTTSSLIASIRCCG